MFLLDTNVISELRKTTENKINPGVKEWAETKMPSTMFLSVITIFELELGILRLERRDKKQGQILRKWLSQLVLPAFVDRVLPINTAISVRSASLHVSNPSSDRDAMIAATAIEHHLTLVTRNTVDFDLTKVKLINPWE
jgi:predicted nucleic acid-binding protein